VATIVKYVSAGLIGNDGHTGDDNVSQPRKTIQHGEDWLAANKQPD
jgi:hypothetical protein